MAKKQSIPSRLKSKFLELDQFGQSVGFEIDGSDQLRSCKGAILSLFLIIIILFYANTKFTILYNRGDTNHQFTLDFDQVGGEPISAEEIGFNLAVGF